jgi:hypothetical protein
VSHRHGAFYDAFQSNASAIFDGSAGRKFTFVV